ncbi:MAG: hypothetical protein QNK37_22485 [Acidobacteriota bacterium]|nr:hypothetical protein [Acidobacteriota bacterium]
MTPKEHQKDHDLSTICMYCRRVRTGPSIWQKLEKITGRLTHGACPTCYNEVLPKFMEEIRKETHFPAAC